MNVKVYVGNLSFGVTEEELRTLFKPYGELSEVILIKDKFSGRSKGFGFVTFADKSAADKAIAEMNGKEVQGRAIKVNEARPMDERPPRRGFNKRGFNRGSFDKRRF